MRASARLMQLAYVGTLAWQVIWLGLLPRPGGPHMVWLAAIACLPLLLPLTGVLRLRQRSLVWGGLVLLLYFIIGVMEAWSNPPQRLAALVQVMLAVFYFVAIKIHSRRR